MPAPVFDVAAASLIFAASSLTYSHTVGSGQNRGLRCGPAYADALAGTATISSVTYNGVAMTLVAGSLQTAILAATYDIGVANYLLANPDSGANNVVITMSESCDAIFGGSDAWSGVNQNNPAGTAAIATGTSTTPTVNVASATEEVPLAAVLAEDDTGAFASGDTERWEVGGGAGAAVSAGSSQIGAASVTMDWSGSMDTIEWVISGFSLKGAATRPAFRLRKP